MALRLGRLKNKMCGITLEFKGKGEIIIYCILLGEELHLCPKKKNRGILDKDCFLDFEVEEVTLP